MCSSDIMSQSSTCTNRSCVYLLGTESRMFSRTSHSDKSVATRPERNIYGLDRRSSSEVRESEWFGDIRLPRLLLFNDVVREGSTHCHFWCALERFAAECDSVWMGNSTSQSQATALCLCLLRAHFNCGCWGGSATVAYVCLFRQEIIQ